MVIKKSPFINLLILFVLLISCQFRREYSQQELRTIGNIVFKNECSDKFECLTAWNKGEEFASFGIGHFIWYPEGKTVVYDESFPELIHYISKFNINVPQWLFHDGKLLMPWKNRIQFMNEFNGSNMVELRNFLYRTMEFQVRFMINRVETVLPKMMQDTDYNSRLKVRKQFYRMYDSESGVYCLIDYTNFKGEGVLSSERYNGYGWGLKQVLKNMEDNGKGNEINDFIKSGELVLTRRVIFSPRERNERRWLQGWLNRIRSYGDLEMSNN